MSGAPPSRALSWKKRARSAVALPLFSPLSRSGNGVLTVREVLFDDACFENVSDPMARGYNDAFAHLRFIPVPLVKWYRCRRFVVLLVVRLRLDRRCRSLGRFSSRPERRNV